MSIRVTVFDDHKKVRDAIAAVIKSAEGLEWGGSYANCNNVIRDVAKSDPDVILMDIEMPGTSGINAVKMLKEKFPHIPIIMQTVFDDDDKIFYSICYGASGYLLKNTAPSNMVEAIRQVYQGGAPMTPSIAARVLALFQQNMGKTPIAEKDYDLSKREKEVLELLVDGLSYKLIAAELHISYDTVHSHIRKIYDKLQVASMTEAVSKALREHLI